MHRDTQIISLRYNSYNRVVIVTFLYLQLSPYPSSSTKYPVLVTVPVIAADSWRPVERDLSQAIDDRAVVVRLDVMETTKISEFQGVSEHARQDCLVRSRKQMA